MAPQPKPTAKQFAKELLLVAKSYLQRGWCTRALAQRANGSDCFVNDTLAVKWSLAGALQAAELELASTDAGLADQAYRFACQALQARIDPGWYNNLLRWNDAEKRLAFDVIRLVEKTAAEDF